MRVLSSASMGRTSRWVAAAAAVAVALALPWRGAAAMPAGATLVKTVDQPVIYYLDGSGVRHAFPNAMTYRSWFGNDFSGVQTVPADELAGYPLGRNATLKPGKWLAKVPSAPTVYAVEQGGLLRPIASPEVAAAIWGPGWQRKVVDVPESLFENYVVGDALSKTHELPNHIVYQINSRPTYYFKRGNLLQPFRSWDDVVANGYAKEDVVAGDRVLPSRARAIAGRDPNVVNPAAAPTVSTQDCGGNPLTAAVVLVARGELDAADRQRLATVRQRLPAAYAWATRELGELDASYAVTVLDDDGLLTRATVQGGRKLTDEAVLTFYDGNPDQFDFLFIFTNFTLQQEPGAELARQVLISNAVAGIGKPEQDSSDLFGSRGKLKSLLIFNDIGGYELEDEADWQRLDDLLLHELAHQFSGSVKFRDGEGESSALLRDDGNHWSTYAAFLSPLGGSGWRALSDGTFGNRLADPTIVRRPFADFDLYLLGLLPAQVILPAAYVEPAFPGVQGNTISGKLRPVTIKQIIAANGPRRCTLR